MANCESQGDEASNFDLSQLDYDLPDELVAQSPSPLRDQARMLVLDRAGGGLLDLSIANLADRLQPGDLLVLNDTKVVAAKFSAVRKTGGTVTGLFILEDKPGTWRVMLTGSRRLREGETLTIIGRSGERIPLQLLEDLGEGQWFAGVEAPGEAFDILERVGEAPLPPYIRRGADRCMSHDEDRKRYQTTFAQVPGAVAAPTAGLHFTEAVLERIRSRGVEIAFVTLHVGIGTFKPIKTARLRDHVMHTEHFKLSQQTANAVADCRCRGGRVVAVGSTSMRVLESTARADQSGMVSPTSGSTDIFIYPPHHFRVVDALLTNFHLPGSTLLALVMAFAGIDETRRAYDHAVENRYRFYSYGDAMFIA